MPETIFAVIITAGASIICQVIMANKSRALMEYRIDKLEDKVTKHNNLVERMVAVEERAKSNSHRLDDVEKRI